jgi:putative ABC transport system permease protein
MLRFNLHLALRSIIKNKTTSLINLFGLSIAFSALLLIVLYVANEWSYDKYNTNLDRIYRVTRKGSDGMGNWGEQGAHVNFAMAEYAKAEFPQDIERAIRFADNSNCLITVGEKSFVEAKAFFTDADVFQVFSWNLVKGNPETVLKDVNSVAISQSAANRYFGSDDPIGKTLVLENETPLLVTGVYDDMPSNSHLKSDLLITMRTRENLENREELMKDPSENDATYLLMSPGADVNRLTADLQVVFDKYYPPNPQGQKHSEYKQYFLWPLKDIHLYFTMDSSTEANGNYVMVYIFSATALLIMLIACINFINLSTARLSQRAKEVGLKKAIGAVRSTLFVQFISEALTFCVISVVVAIAAAWIMLPYFNELIGKQLNMEMLANPAVWTSLLVLVVFISFIAGGYPAWFLSSFKSADVLRRGVGVSWRKFSLRSALVGMQFFLAFVMIVAVSVVRKQLTFVNNYNLGFNSNSLIVLPSSSAIFQRFRTIKEQLEQYPGIELVSFSSRVPSGRLSDAQDARIEENGEMKNVAIRIGDVHVDHDFLNVLNLPLVAGRNFDRALASDTIQAFILNETAVSKLGWKSPEDAIGKVFHYGSLRKGTVVGVAKDINFESLHEPIKPTVYVISRGRQRSVVMRIDETKKADVLKHLEEQWRYLRPGFPFTYYTLTDNLERQYEKETKVGEGIMVFATFAVIVSSLGVFGLALFMAEQRSKEMGIRKALGASIGNVLVLLGRWFFMLMLVAGVVAVPVSYWMASGWLETFAFAADVGVGPFLLSFGVVALCTAASIIVQIYRTANQNPVNALRYE